METKENKKICVITGGGSGMGLAAAKYMPKDKVIIVSGRTVKKLEKAVSELKELGYEAYAHACDTSDRQSVRKLAEYAEHYDEEAFVKNNGMECCECGCCSYVCPAKRPLTQVIKAMRKMQLAKKKKQEENVHERFDESVI